MFTGKLQEVVLVVWCLLFGAANASLNDRALRGMSIIFGHPCTLSRTMLTEYLERASFPPSNITNLTAQFFPSQGSKRVQVTYGPFNVPNMNIDNGMQDFFQAPVEIPCKDCLITYIQAGLTYPNGTYANANTSLWLHHVVLYNLNNVDAVCPTNLITGVPGERFFASGNERSPANICING